MTRPLSDDTGEGTPGRARQKCLALFEALRQLDFSADEILFAAHADGIGTRVGMAVKVEDTERAKVWAKRHFLDGTLVAELVRHGLYPKKEKKA